MKRAFITTGIVTLALLSVNIQRAVAFDVIGKNAVLVVTTKGTDKSAKIAFSLCSVKQKSCSLIGDKNGYTADELKDKRVELQLTQAAYVAGGVLATGLLVGATAGFGFPIYALFGGGAEGLFYGAFVGGSVTFGIAHSSMSKNTNISSAITGFVKPYTNSRALRDSIIKDSDFSATDEEVLGAAVSLSEVLKEIDAEKAEDEKNAQRDIDNAIKAIKR